MMRRYIDMRSPLVFKVDARGTVCGLGLGCLLVDSVEDAKLLLLQLLVELNEVTTYVLNTRLGLGCRV